MKARVYVGFGLSLLLLVILWSCDTSADKPFKDYFISYYEGDGNTEAKDMLINDDGSIIMVGTSTDLAGASEIRRVHLVKTDAEGKIIWSKRYGSLLGETAADIELIKTGAYAGNFLLLSNVKKNAQDSTLVKVRRIDQEGSKIDSIVYDLWAWQFAYSITPTSDGGFVFTGNCDPNAKKLEPGVEDIEDESDLLTVKYTQSGVRETGGGWFPIRGESIVLGVKIFESGQPINPYLIAGYSNENKPVGETSFWFAQVTSLGTPNGDIYPTDFNQNEYMAAIAKSPFGSYLAIGTQQISGSNRLFGIMVDQTFINTLGRVPGGATILGAPAGAEPVSVTGSQDGPFKFWVLANDVASSDGRDIWVARVDGYNLETEFQMKFGAANNDDTGAALAELPNGDLLILGTVELVNQKKMALIRVKPNGRF